MKKNCKFFLFRIKLRSVVNFSSFLKYRWIRRKYERKEFLCPLDNQISLSDQLERSIRNQDVQEVFKIVSQSNGNQRSSNDFLFNGNQQTTLIQLAVSTNNIAITQLIFWYYNFQERSDANGKKTLDYAKSNEMKEFLKTQGCTESKQKFNLILENRSPKSSMINKTYNRNDQHANNFSLRENFLNRDTNSAHKNNSQLSGLVNSDVCFDQLPTSII